MKAAIKAAAHNSIFKIQDYSPGFQVADLLKKESAKEQKAKHEYKSVNYYFD